MYPYYLIEAKLTLDELICDSKEYDAPWLKNANTVVRDAGGRFTSKAGSAASSTKDTVSNAVDQAGSKVSGTIDSARVAATKLSDKARQNAVAMITSKSFLEGANKLGDNLDLVEPGAKQAFKETFNVMVKVIKPDSSLEKILKTTRRNVETIQKGLKARYKKNITPEEESSIGVRSVATGVAVGGLMAAAGLSGALAGGIAVAAGSALLAEGGELIREETKPVMDRIKKELESMGLGDAVQKIPGLNFLADTAKIMTTDPKEVKDWVEKEDAGSGAMLAEGLALAALGTVTLASIPIFKEPGLLPGGGQQKSLAQKMYEEVIEPAMKEMEKSKNQQAASHLKKEIGDSVLDAVTNYAETGYTSKF